MNVKQGVFVSFLWAVLLIMLWEGIGFFWKDQREMAMVLVFFLAIALTATLIVGIILAATTLLEVYERLGDKKEK